MLGSIIAAAAPAVIGGLFGARSESSSTTTSSKINYKNLMKARQYGLNPLTMIGSGQVPMSTTTHGKLAGPDPFMQALGEGFSNAADTWFNKDERELEHEVNKLKRDILKEELNVLQERNSQELVNQSFGFSIPKAVQSGPTAGDTAKSVYDVFQNNVAKDGTLRPLARTDQPTIPIMAPDGKTQGNMPIRTAKRLGINPYDQLTGGEVEELMGELVGGAMTTSNFDSIPSAQGFPWFDESQPRLSNQGSRSRGGRRGEDKSPEKAKKPGMVWDKTKRKWVYPSAK